MNPMKFETVAAPGGYRVHYKDKRNGKIILWSEVYSDLPGAKRAIFLTKLHVPPWSRNSGVSFSGARARNGPGCGVTPARGSSRRALYSGFVSCAGARCANSAAISSCSTLLIQSASRDWPVACPSASGSWRRM